MTGSSIWAAKSQAFIVDGFNFGSVGWLELVWLVQTMMVGGYMVHLSLRAHNMLMWADAAEEYFTSQSLTSVCL